MAGDASHVEADERERAPCGGVAILRPGRGDLRHPIISRSREARARLSDSPWSFLGESRRIDNRRMREELGVTLAYQDLDAGIRASL